MFEICGILEWNTLKLVLLLVKIKKIMHSQINFYLLSTSDEEARLNFCARLVETAFSRGHRILILCGNKKQVLALDALLWSFKAESFIPHLIDSEVTSETKRIPIVLTTSENSLIDDYDVLLSMSSQVIADFKKFDHILEVVDQREETLKLSRNHYKKYRQHGYSVTTHKI